MDVSFGVIIQIKLPGSQKVDEGLDYVLDGHVRARLGGEEGW